MKQKTYLVALLLLAMQGVKVQAQVNNAAADTTQTDTTDYDKMYDLETVTVTTQRKLVKNDIDKLTYDVANDETARNKNTLDMLRNVPLVTVSGADEITVKGSSAFKVYRNGHPDPTLSSQNLKDVLKAMPASQIKKVEVITDPGAKEDAEGTQYILNLVMADGRGMEGVVGTVSANYGFLKENTGVNGSITTQWGKLAASVSYGLQHGKQEQGNIRDTYYVQSGNRLQEENFSQMDVDVQYGNLNLSYEIDSLNLATMSFGGYWVGVDIDDFASDANMTSNGAPVYSYRSILSYPSYNFYNFGGRFDYQHKTRRPGEMLTASYQLQMTRNHENQLQRYEEAVNLPVPYTGTTNDNRERFMEHTFQLDYVLPLGKWLKWNAGAKYILRSNKSDAWLTYTGAGDMDRHTLFDHETQVAAAYTEWIYSGTKLQARAGLRYEYSKLKAEYPNGEQADFDKHLGDWVPSASVRYAFNDANALKLSFSTTISRPGIDYLNPARVSSPTTLTYGNPGLNSSAAYGMGMEYSYVSTKFTAMLGVQHSFCNSLIGSLSFDDNDIYVTTYGDQLHYRTTTIWGYLQTALWSGARLTFNPAVSRVVHKDGATGLANMGWSSWNSVSFAQKLPLGLMLDLGGGFGIGRQTTSLYSVYSPSNYYYGTLQRSFLKEDRLTVSLTAANIFGSHRYGYTSHSVQGDFRGYNTHMQTRKGVTLSVSWRIGSLKGGVKNVERTIENNDVVGGISAGGGNK